MHNRTGCGGHPGPIKALLIQRMIPDYRVPIFQGLAAQDKSLRWEFACSRAGSLCQGLSLSKEIGKLPVTQFRAVARTFKVGNTTNTFVWWPCLLPYLLRRRPDVVMTEGGSNILNNFAVAVYCRLFRKPYVWWGLGTVRKPRPSLWRRTFGPILDAFYRRAGAIVAYNSHARDFFVSRGASPDKVFVAQNTIDDSEVRRQMAVYRPQVAHTKKHLELGNGPCLLYIGRLIPAKRLDVLIRALAILNEELDRKPDLLVVGDGPAFEDLRSLASELRVSQHVFFAGRHVNDASLYVMMADLLVLPGLGGLAINHAFAHGIPVVCGKADGGERDLIRNGVNGILIEEHITPEVLSEVLGPLLRDRTRLAEMGREARETYMTKASPSAMLDAILRAVNVACAALRAQASESSEERHVSSR